MAESGETGKPKARKRGGQKGNTNAKGHGAPKGNTNAEKHGAYSRPRLTAEEWAGIESLTGEFEGNAIRFMNTRFASR